MIGPTLKEIAGCGPALANLKVNSNGTVELTSQLSILQYYAAHAPITLDDAVTQCERANGRQDNWMEPWRGFNLLQVLETLAVMRLSYARAMVEVG